MLYTAAVEKRLLKSSSKLASASIEMFRNILPVVSRQSIRHYQLPAKHAKKVIPVYPPAEPVSNPLVINELSATDLAKLDPSGAKRNLISANSETRISAGDVVRVVYDSKKCNYDNFMGYVLSVDRKKLVQDASLLLRDHINKTSVEMRVPIFSPLVERIDLIRKSDGRRRRNKHYYIRNTRLDVGDLDANMRKKK